VFFLFILNFLKIYLRHKQKLKHSIHFWN